MIHFFLSKLHKKYLFELFLSITSYFFLSLNPLILSSPHFLLQLINKFRGSIQRKKKWIFTTFPDTLLLFRFFKTCIRHKSTRSKWILRFLADNRSRFIDISSWDIITSNFITNLFIYLSSAKAIYRCRLWIFFFNNLVPPCKFLCMWNKH